MAASLDRAGLPRGAYPAWRSRNDVIGQELAREDRQ